MIHEIQAKTLLSHAKNPDPWFGIKYGMNIYRGCQHQCIYCDSRSECYGIEDFGDVLVKANALELLPRELASKRKKGLVGTGAMSDPYTPVEADYRLTGRALEIIAQQRFPLHIITKSDMVLRDVDTLVDISRVKAFVSFTITTADDGLASKIEPGAPSPSRRLEAISQLAAHGVSAGVTMMPILPFIEDDDANITAIIERAVGCGASYVIPWFGMTLRDRQRAYYYEKLDADFPGLRERYEAAFGGRYEASSPREAALAELYGTLQERYGFAAGVPPYDPEPSGEQLSLF